MYSFYEYKQFYEEKGYLPEGQYSPQNKKLSESKLEKKYEKYLEKKLVQEEKRQEQYEKKLEENLQKIEQYIKDKENREVPVLDERWIQMRESVYLRDNYRCQLYQCLTSEEKQMFINNIGAKWLSILNPAHIFKVGSNPFIKYLPEYVVTMNQASHGLLDASKCPITGKMISVEEVEMWWKRILGQNCYEKLKSKLK